jgi:hypothetical protein
VVGDDWAGRGRAAHDMDRFLQTVKAYGRVQFVNAQVMTPFLTNQPAEKLLRDIDTLSVAALTGKPPVDLDFNAHYGSLSRKTSL